MYLPKKFKNENNAEVLRFCQTYSFATIISGGSEDLQIGHLPVLISTLGDQTAKITGHMAKANPQWRSWRPDTQVTCIFLGPNRYISPAWYKDTLNVPTWNYAVVHITGTPIVYEEHDSIETILKSLVDHHEKLEGAGWDYSLPEEFRRNMTRAIVGFEIHIESIEAKFKLSQNREDSDRAAAIAALSIKKDDASMEMVRLMKAHWPENRGLN